MPTFDPQALADLKTEEAALASSFKDVCVELNDLKESDDPTNYQQKFAKLELRHGQKARELEILRNQIQRVEATAPLSPEEQRANKGDPLRRWMQKGDAELTQEEKEIYLGDVDTQIQAVTGGASGQVFNVPLRSNRLRLATNHEDTTRSDDDTGTAKGSAGKATQDIVLPRVVERLSYFGAVREIASVMQTSHGNKITLPQMDGKDDEGEYLGSVPQKRTDGDLIKDLPLPAVQDISWDAFVVNSKRFKIRLETLDDLVFDAAGRAVMHAHRRMARICNKKYTQGTGTNEPEGVMQTAREALTTKISGTITYEDFTDLEYAIDLAYLDGNEGNMDGFSDILMGRVGIMCHRNVEKIFRQMLDGDGRPLWVPSIRDGAANMFAGYSYVLNNHMDDVAANNHPLLFGNTGHFGIREVNQVQVFRFFDSSTIKHYGIEIIAFARNDSRCMGPLYHTGARDATRSTTDCEAYMKLKIKA